MKRIFSTLLYIIVMILGIGLNASAQTKAKPESWVVYYTDKLPAKDFESYDLIAFDSDHYPPIDALKAQGKIVLGYLSFGEAEKYRSYFKTIKDKKLLLEKSDLWKDHFYIDVRNEAWTKMLIEELIPQVLAKGFDGIMIDTMDTPIYVETLDTKKYAGMTKASVKLIKDVRAAFPNIKLMMNRGLEILPDVAGDIDYLMAESTYTDWTKNPKKPMIVAKKDYDYYLDLINRARAISPTLKVYSMDYWDMKDSKGVKHIYAKQREQGFIPYVSTMDLQHLHAEPK